MFVDSTVGCVAWRESAADHIANVVDDMGHVRSREHIGRSVLTGLVA